MSNWLIHAANLLVDNYDKVDVEDWEIYIAGVESDNYFSTLITNAVVTYRTIVKDWVGGKCSILRYRV